MDIPVTGHCRCGSSRFVLRDEPIAFYLCHCTQCQAESGSAFGQTMHVRAESLGPFEGPLREHTLHGPEGRQMAMTQCTGCLTVLSGRNVAIPQVVGINAGSLENVAGLTPYGNMWTRSARPWVSLAPGPRFEQLPEDPLAMIRAWKSRPGAGSTE